MPKFEVESGVPIPEKRGPYVRYPFRAMEVGDSFFVSENDRSRKNMDTAANGAKRAGIGRFTVANVEGGYRVWRIE